MLNIKSIKNRNIIMGIVMTLVMVGSFTLLYDFYIEQIVYNTIHESNIKTLISNIEMTSSWIEKETVKNGDTESTIKHTEDIIKQTHKNNRVYVIDKEYNLLVSHDYENDNTTNSIILGKVYENIDTISKHKSGVIKYEIMGNTKEMHYSTIPNTDNWKIIVETRTDNIRNAVDNVRSATNIVGLLVIAIGLTASLILANTNSNYILDFKKTFDRVSEGDLTVRAKESKIEEISEAGSSFNNMMIKINEMNYTDSITGVYNRLSFTEYINFMLDNEERFSIMLISIDKFKKINDAYGISCGDSVLENISKRIKEVVGDESTVFRFSGDEFIVVFKGNIGRAHLIKQCESIMSRLKDVINIEGNEIFTSSSVGIAFYPENGVRPETILKNVSLAKSSVKNIGGDGYKIYDESMNLELIEAINMEKEMHTAIEKEEFYMEYQPIVDVKSGKIVGSEALLRWTNTNLGRVSPGKFIPIAEETGLIVPLGTWVLRTASKQTKDLHDKGYKDTYVCINVSVHQFEQDNFVETVKSVIEEVGIKPGCIHLEITEGVAMSNIDRAIIKLNELKEIGVKISIDDFGTGYSSLSYFYKFPVDTMKIDQSFIRNLGVSEQSKSIVSTLILMGNSLGVDIVAEGVETEAQLEFVRSHSCTKIQGYLFSKPVHPSELESKLRENKTFM